MKLVNEYAVKNYKIALFIIKILDGGCKKSKIMDINNVCAWQRLSIIRQRTSIINITDINVCALQRLS